MRRLFGLLLTLLAGMALSGCRTTSGTDGSDVDQLPWNTPASWEGQIMGVPY